MRIEMCAPAPSAKGPAAAATATAQACANSSQTTFMSLPLSASDGRACMQSLFGEF